MKSLSMPVDEIELLKLVDAELNERLKSRLETNNSPAAKITLILLSADGYPPLTLRRKIPSWRQPRLCAWCLGEFIPKLWAVRFCGTSCSAKWRMRQSKVLRCLHNPKVAAARGKKKAAWFKAGSPKALKELERIRNLNPMSDPAVRLKVSQILREMKHKPSVRGGNGTGLTKPQSILLALLAGWTAEFPLSLGRRRAGYPTHYKLDLANPEKKLCIEVDGACHYGRKEKDAKKDAILVSLGLRVLRFWNADI